MNSKKNNIIPLFLCVLLLIGLRDDVKGQLKYLDSLRFVLKNAKHDTTKLRLRNDIGNETPILRIGYWDSIASDANALKSKGIESNALAWVGYICIEQGNVPKALDYYKRSLKVTEEIGFKRGIAIALNNIGVIYHNQGDIPKALDYHSRGLKIYEEIGEKQGVAYSLINIGFIYKNLDDAPNALKYYHRSLKIQEEIGDKLGITGAMHNIGTIYYEQGDSTKALDYFERSLKIMEETGDKKRIGYSLSSIATIYQERGDIAKALPYFFRSLKVRQEVGDKQGIAYSLNSIGGVYLYLGSIEKTVQGKRKNYELAHVNADSSLIIAKALGFPEIIRNAEKMLSKIDSVLGNHLGAFEHYKQFIIYRDSIINETTRKASVKNQLKYEYGKKEAVMIEQQEKQRLIAKEKDRFQQIVIVSVIGGLLLVVVFAIFVFRSLKSTRTQKHIIEEKQKEILDSIHYAKRIQTVLMPHEKHIDKNLKRLRKN